MGALVGFLVFFSARARLLVVEAVHRARLRVGDLRARGLALGLVVGARIRVLVEVALSVDVGSHAPLFLRAERGIGGSLGGLLGLFSAHLRLLVVEAVHRARPRVGDLRARGLLDRATLAQFGVLVEVALSVDVGSRALLFLRAGGHRRCWRFCFVSHIFGPFNDNLAFHDRLVGRAIVHVVAFRLERYSGFKILLALHPGEGRILLRAGFLSDRKVVRSSSLALEGDRLANGDGDRGPLALLQKADTVRFGRQCPGVPRALLHNDNIGIRQSSERAERDERELHFFLVCVRVSGKNEPANLCSTYDEKRKMKERERRQVALSAFRRKCYYNQ